MATTTNFGWTTPNDTDYVTQGAAAMRTLGNGIDTTLVDLKGGTTDQVLAKNSNTDMDFKWVENGEVLLSTTTLSGSVTTVSSISGAYKELKIVLQGVNVSATGGDLQLYFNNGNDHDTTYQRSTSSTARTGNTILLGDSMTGSVTTNAWTLNVRDYASTTLYKPLDYSGAYSRDVAGTATRSGIIGGGTYSATSAISQVNISTGSTATFSAGTLRIYGVN
jgi:hypothetical protein